MREKELQQMRQEEATKYRRESEAAREELRKEWQTKLTR